MKDFSSEPKAVECPKHGGAAGLHPDPLRKLGGQFLHSRIGAFRDERRELASDFAADRGEVPATARTGGDAACLSVEAKYTANGCLGDAE